MITGRSQLIDERRAGCSRLISRCVRRALLCGDAAEHRRAWLERGTHTQSDAFAVDVLTYCVMSNHLHIVIRTDPEQAQQWSAREVVERWSMVFPDREPATGEPIAWDPADIDRHAREDVWVAVRRARLASVSWFMRILKQRIARRAKIWDRREVASISSGYTPR